MPKKDEHTSPRVATLASRVLSGDKKPTPKEIRSLAAAALTNAPDRKKGK